MSQDQSAAELLSAADPALTITEEELTRSRHRSLSFKDSEVTHIAVGGSVHDFHRAPAKRHWRRFVAVGLATAAVAAGVLLASGSPMVPVNKAAAPADQPVAGATATAAPTPVPAPSTTSPSAEATPSGGTVPSTGPAIAVNPEDYRSEAGAGYFFTSPSGNLLCGFLTDFRNMVGCEARSLVANMPRCDDPRANAPMISLTSAGAVDATCTNQGVYLMPDAKAVQDDNGVWRPAVQTKVLQYGQEIHVGTFSCQSQEAGITCREARTGNAFLASREEFAQIPW